MLLTNDQQKALDESCARADSTWVEFEELNRRYEEPLNAYFRIVGTGRSTPEDRIKQCLRSLVERERVRLHNRLDISCVRLRLIDLTEVNGEMQPCAADLIRASCDRSFLADPSRFVLTQEQESSLMSHLAGNLERSMATHAFNRIQRANPGIWARLASCNMIGAGTSSGSDALDTISLLRRVAAHQGWNPEPLNNLAGKLNAGEELLDGAHGLLVFQDTDRRRLLHVSSTWVMAIASLCRGTEPYSRLRDAQKLLEIISTVRRGDRITQPASLAQPSSSCVEDLVL